ncbi:hypothetical protein [Methylobacterium sp. J-067]|uniref:hypothetical protein n=1 Tax=Methylobacterium sp. J-067 TaxID=2836648 RepID=UPI001FBA7576|nr:hypothetical protein [Methylobacterium sp. J-067]MCJ2025037.1 hypothetical protein [Methylobacterium sp. J-067]
MNTHALRHRWFDKWLTAGSPEAQRLVDAALNIVGQYEEGSRKRKRKPEDDRRHRIMVEAVAMNLAHTVLMPSDTGHLAVMTGHMQRPRSRYDHPAFGDTFGNLLTSFASIGWLTFSPSPGMGEASAIAPTSMLKAKVSGIGINLSGIARGIGEPVILSQKDDASAQGPTRELVDYPETTMTHAFRSDMESLNSFLVGADLDFMDDNLGMVDLHQRQQRRYFTLKPGATDATFDRGGRMFGGWWSNLPKTRRGNIRIEGEPVCILDYSSMFVRLAYALIGKEPPPDDLYAIPGLIGYRRATKLIVNCLMFDEYERKRWPKVDRSDHEMPRGLTMPRVRDLITDHHPDLIPCFGMGMGHELMMTESTILMEVLKEMKFRGVPGLGLHDGLMAPAPRMTEVRTMMEVVSRQITSHTIPVTAECIPSALVQ